MSVQIQFSNGSHFNFDTELPPDALLKVFLKAKFDGDLSRDMLLNIHFNNLIKITYDFLSESRPKIYKVNQFIESVDDTFSARIILFFNEYKPILKWNSLNYEDKVQFIKTAFLPYQVDFDAVLHKIEAEK